MKNILTAIIFILLTGCSKNDSLAFIMEVSFTEQFTNACGENIKCVEVVDSYMEFCFNKELAVAAIEAEKNKKEEINTKHILITQKCLSGKTGIDYWKEIHMPTYILSKAK